MMVKINNIDQRIKLKKNLVLQIIRKNPNISRSDIKQISGFSMESILQYINELIEDELIVSSGVSKSAVGRKATLLRINPFGCYFIGIKFNAKALTGVVTDFDGSTIRKKILSFPEGIEAAEVITSIENCIKDLLDSLGNEKKKVRGIGVAVPGYVNKVSGVAKRYVHIKNWREIPLKEIIEGRFNMPAHIEQSVKVTAMALKMEPQNTDIKDMLYILVGRGVGMVIISNNEICNGFDNGAGEIGHIFVANNKRRCECGKIGCLETEASEKAILMKVQEGIMSGKHPVLMNALANNRQPTIEDFINSVKLNDPDSMIVMQSLCRHLSRAVANAVTLLNPKKIIFSGDLVQLPGFLECMNNEIQAICPADSISSLVLERKDIDNTYDAYGSAMMALSHEFVFDKHIFRDHETEFYI